MSFRPNRRLCTTLAVAAYLVVALVAFRNVAASPSTLLSHPSILNARPGMVYLDHWDQAMVVATVIRNADLLVSRPWDLFADVGQCYPMPRAYTLGEHMFGVGLLAALPYALTGDPILTYNIVLILTLWIPAITMYFLALRFTRSPPAAFVAGLAFALVPGRLIDPAHPYVHGDLWAPGVLLFLHRLFVSRRWFDAIGLALFLNLEVFESLYPLISTCIVAGTYGVYLLFRHRTVALQVLPRLAVALALALLGVWLVLFPYLDTSATWGLLAGRSSVLLAPKDLLPGGGYFTGYFVLALVAIAMLDRLRGPRLVHGEDPRIAMFVAALLVTWSAMRHTPLPGLGFGIGSPFLTLRGILPGLEAVRALASIAIGSGIATSFLVGYGVLALTERLRPLAWAPLAGAVACALVLLGLRFVPPLAEASFGRTFQLTTYEARPPQEQIDLLRAAGRGPLIDYPIANQNDEAKRLDIAEGLLLASYDPRPLGACYNSFRAPVNQQVAKLAAGLPDPTAAEALGALGFETVFLNRRRSGPINAKEFEEARASSAAAKRSLQPIGETAEIAAFRIVTTAPVEESLDLLQPATSAQPLVLGVGQTDLEFPVTNEGPATFRLRPPVEPTDLVIRWHAHDGTVALEETRRGLLPIALAPGGELPLTVPASMPGTPGDYVVTLARAAQPDRLIGRRAVRLPALEEVMNPAEITMHLHKPFVDLRILPSGFDRVRPPEAVVEMFLGPDAGSASDIERHGRITAHWWNLDGLVGSYETEADVVQGDPRGYVRGRVPVPEKVGLHLVLITPADDPRQLLAGRAVQLDPPAGSGASRSAPPP